MMAVMLPVRSQFFEPFIDVGKQAIFGDVHPYTRRNVHRGTRIMPFWIPLFFSAAVTSAVMFRYYR